MREKDGKVFSIAKDNVPVSGCTVSRVVQKGTNDNVYFSMAENTYISEEIFQYYKLILMSGGSITVSGPGNISKLLSEGEGIITQKNKPVGMNTDNGG